MTAHVETKIWLALKSRIETIPLSFDKAWPAAIYRPSASRPFIRVGKVQVAPQSVFLENGKPSLRTGSLIITLVHPLGQDVSVYEQMQGDIAAHFRDGTEMQYQGVCVTVPNYPHSIEGYLDGAWWNAPVSIPWRCFA